MSLHQIGDSSNEIRLGVNLHILFSVSPSPSQASIQSKKLLMTFPWVETSTGLGGLMVCECILYNGSTRRLTESRLMEKPGIEPATPGLQGIGLSPTPRPAYGHGPLSAHQRNAT